MKEIRPSINTTAIAGHKKWAGSQWAGLRGKSEAKAGLYRQWQAVDRKVERSARRAPFACDAWGGRAQFVSGSGQRNCGMRRNFAVLAAGKRGMVFLNCSKKTGAIARAN